MTIEVEGYPVLVKFVSRNNQVTLYSRSDTKIIDGYAHNVYSQYGSNGPIKFHKKLKIYRCESYGYYIICQGIRAYINSMMNHLE